jgi:hypothetical protein
MRDEPLWWIAINGSSCARSAMPLWDPRVTPVPEELVGFSTKEEAEAAQRICLRAPLRVVRQFWANLRPDIMMGRIRVIRLPNPQPQTSGLTTWIDGDADTHALVQRHFIESTAN